MVFFPLQSFAQDTYVRGYTKKDGTYVAPHIRSAPDSIKSNNLGPSESAYGRLSPYGRDNDSDGFQNRYDSNDDNDSYMDNYDRNQYNRSR